MKLQFNSEAFVFVFVGETVREGQRKCGEEVIEVTCGSSLHDI